MTEHEHHHDNHRESFSISHGEAFLEAHMHDQAATVSIAICPNAGETVEFNTIVDIMRDIATRAESCGGIIGHIKAFARDGDAFAHASITDANLDATCEGDLTQRFGEEADVQIVAIVLLITQDDLVGLCKEALLG